MARLPRKSVESCPFCVNSVVCRKKTDGTVNKKRPLRPSGGPSKRREQSMSRKWTIQCELCGLEKKTSHHNSRTYFKITDQEKQSAQLRKATIRPKRRFVPSDNSSQIPKSDNSSQATIRPILKRRQFVPIIKSCNLSPI